jgi:hypothetical protein
MNRPVTRRSPPLCYGISGTADVADLPERVDNGIDAGFARQGIEKELSKRALTVAMEA